MSSVIYAPGTSKRLLDLVSSAAHEIVTRKKLSGNIKRSASLVSEALQALLADDLDNLPGVLELLDEAAALLNRPSSNLNGARNLIDGGSASKATPIGVATASKRKASSKKTAGKRAANKKIAGKKTSAKKTAGKKTSSKKTSATTATSRAAGKKTSGKRSAAGKRVATKAIARG